MACDYLDRINYQRKSEEMRQPLPQGWESAAEQAAHLPAATTTGWNEARGISFDLTFLLLSCLVLVLPILNQLEAEGYTSL